jgi:C4-dicarboxylate transporter
MVTTATGLSRLVGSALFGVLWNAWSLQAAVAVFAAALAVALLMTARTWLRLENLQ